jgi:hypothetical protein
VITKATKAHLPKTRDTNTSSQDWKRNCQELQIRGQVTYRQTLVPKALRHSLFQGTKKDNNSTVLQNCLFIFWSAVGHDGVNGLALQKIKGEEDFYPAR